MSALLKRADDSLYAAKHGGRDRVGSGLAPRTSTALRSA
jgi:PleD family two-component response regulator